MVCGVVVLAKREPVSMRDGCPTALRIFPGETLKLGAVIEELLDHASSPSLRMVELARELSQISSPTVCHRTTVHAPLLFRVHGCGSSRCKPMHHHYHVLEAHRIGSLTAGAALDSARAGSEIIAIPDKNHYTKLMCT